MAVMPIPNSGFPYKPVQSSPMGGTSNPVTVTMTTVNTKLRYVVQTNHYRPTAKVAKKSADESWEDNSSFAFPFDAMQRAIELTKTGYPIRILDLNTGHHIGIDVADVDPGAVEVPAHILEALEEQISGNVHEDTPKEG